MRVENANCEYCMNAVRKELLARPMVHDVRMHVAQGCWEVEHDYDDLSAITELLRTSLRGWVVESNGEIMMVATTPEIADRCAWHPHGGAMSG